MPGALQAATHAVITHTDWVEAVRATYRVGGCNCSRGGFIGMCLGAQVCGVEIKVTVAYFTRFSLTALYVSSTGHHNMIVSYQNPLFVIEKTISVSQLS